MDLSVDIPGVRISKPGIQTTTLTVTLAIKNPLPVGGTIRSAEFDLYLLKDGNEEFLGDGEKENFDIGAACVTEVEVPVRLKNLSLLSAAAGLVGGDLDVMIRGTIAVDLKIISPKIPFEKKVTIKGLL